MNDLIHLIYASSATQKMSSDDLVAILKKAREKNHSLGVTGMLLFQGGNFLQVLEGDRAVVENLYETIRQDPRHYQVTRLISRGVQQREFEEWEMGFTNLDTMDLAALPGYSPYLNEAFTSARFKDKSYAYTFLRIFKENMR
ncbi:MAG: BLUF domain-containing protein [Anaerolineae bacterium]|nr:BLUF domain-containing protein [Anaerolineae bacterium]